jgi:hypothetical protein
VQTVTGLKDNILEVRVEEVIVGAQHKHSSIDYEYGRLKDGFDHMRISSRR